MKVVCEYFVYGFILFAFVGEERRVSCVVSAGTIEKEEIKVLKEMLVKV